MSEKQFKVIDDNMHFLPTDLFTNEKILNGFLYSAPITLGVKVYLAKTPDGAKDQIVLATESGEEILNYVEGDYTLETKIRAMDEAGVDIAMLRMPVWQEWLPLEICKIVNDQAAEMCRRSEGRLVANAVVPPWGRKEDVAELKRCIEELGRAFGTRALPSCSALRCGSLFRPRPASAAPSRSPQGFGAAFPP